MDLSGKHILVLGAGSSGIAACRLAYAKNAAQITLLDTASASVSGSHIVEDLPLSVEIFWGKEAEAWHGQADCVVYSPGIPLGSVLDQTARNSGAVAFFSEPAFAMLFLTAPVLAVTGTNGKTTTVEMLHHILKQAGYRTVAAGNIGLPLSDVACQGKPLDWIVAEISSFQLEHPGSIPPKAAALLNVTPDHLNRHGSMKNYESTKLSIFFGCRSGLVPVLRADLLAHASVASCVKGHRYLTFSADDAYPADFTVRDGMLLKHCADGTEQELISVNRLPWHGTHNLENALAALALAEAAGLNVSDLSGHLATFAVGPHRIQEVHRAGKLIFVDDSKATDLDAMVKALETVRRIYPGKRVALIAGGLDKGCDLSSAAPFLARSVDALFLIGQCRQTLQAVWASGVSKCVCCDSLEEAVSLAASHFPSGEGGVILLSPACASMDMFRDYADRGNQFSALAKKIAGISRNP